MVRNPCSYLFMAGLYHHSHSISCPSWCGHYILHGHTASYIVSLYTCRCLRGEPNTHYTYVSWPHNPKLVEIHVALLETVHTTKTFLTASPDGRQNFSFLHIHIRCGQPEANLHKPEWKFISLRHKGCGLTCRIMKANGEVRSQFCPRHDSCNIFFYV